MNEYKWRTCTRRARAKFNASGIVKSRPHPRYRHRGYGKAARANFIKVVASLGNTACDLHSRYNLDKIGSGHHLSLPCIGLGPTVRHLPTRVRGSTLRCTRPFQSPSEILSQMHTVKPERPPSQILRSGNRTVLGELHHKQPLAQGHN